MNLYDYGDFLTVRPVHIATVSPDNKANLAIVSDIRIIDKNRVIISHNEMINTPNNIQTNSNVCITSFNFDWIGVRLYGTAEYYSEGEYLDLAIKHFKNENTNPVGAIIVTVNKLEELK